MECHRCPHRESIEAGRYARMPFEQTPCAACELKENSAFTMAYDDERKPEGINLVPLGKRDVPCPIAEDDEQTLPLSVMREAITALLLLRPDVRDVVCWRFTGMKYRDIAALHGVTTAAVELRLRRAMRQWPALQVLFAEKSAKQERRRKKVSRRGRVGVSK